MWFKVDDKLHDHRKAHQAGKAAMGVWVMAGSWSSDNGEGGFVPERVVTRWGNKRDAAALVDAGLWLPHTKDDEPGWLFHDWDERNPDEESVKAIKDAEHDGGTLGNHRRWHVKRGIVSKSCPHCQGGFGADSGTRDQGDIGSGGFAPESSVPSRPDPVPLSVVTYPSQSPTALRALTDEDWQKIERATKGPRPHAVAVATFILDRASSDVTNPRRYILRAIANEPELHKFNRGNPTKDTECREHAGEWGDACRQCALEQRLGDLA